MKKTLNTEEFGRRLSALRESKNVKASNVVTKIQIETGKCSTSAYNDYECGKRFPPIEVLVAISNYFDVSLEYLLFGETEEINTAVDKVINGCKKEDVKSAYMFMSQILTVLERSFDI